MLVEPDAGARLGHDRRERGLADLKRIAPQIVSVQFDQVESVQERAVIMAAVANEIERGDAVLVAGNGFAVAVLMLMARYFVGWLDRVSD